MTSPGPNNTSQTARLMADPPGFAVGWQTPVYLPNPPVGGNWQYTVDGRYTERVVAVWFAFTASAVVGNRNPRLVLQDTNGTNIAAVPGGSGVAAGGSIAASLTIGSTGQAGAGAGNTYGFLPDLLIPAGWSWTSAVGGMDAGDQFSSIVLLVQRFPNDAASITAGE